ncbi:hypothetical protein PoB_003593800 [Plakobranchus ocellatus]|uniref:Uncharacterized protein n=1 Tax=Plakobranchus ocellatus TaxID=259542 RepID=A0AAV4AS82_9GAST|nr:hypothetical protein PoB_003593800 [Plakobranchus ocellatus]
MQRNTQEKLTIVSRQTAVNYFKLDVISALFNGSKPCQQALPPSLTTKPCTKPCHRALHEPRYQAFRTGASLATKPCYRALQRACHQAMPSGPITGPRHDYYRTPPNPETRWAVRLAVTSRRADGQ